MRGHHFAHWVKYHLGLDPAATQTTPAEREAIRCHSKGCRSIVEIGVFEGVTSLILRESMSPVGTLYCVDPFPKGALGFSYDLSISQREIGKSNKGSVEFLCKFSHAAVQGWNKPIDFIFIDGDHSDSGVRTDWQDWSPHIIPGGYAAFHDSVSATDSWGPPALVREIHEYCRDFELTCQVDSLSILKRVSST